MGTKLNPSCSNPECATLWGLSPGSPRGGEVRWGLSQNTPSSQPFTTLFSQCKDYSKMLLQGHCVFCFVLFCSSMLWPKPDNSSQRGETFVLSQGWGGPQAIMAGSGRTVDGTLCGQEAERDTFSFCKIKSVTLVHVAMLPTFRLGLPILGKPITDLHRGLSPSWRVKFHPIDLARMWWRCIGRCSFSSRCQAIAWLPAVSPEVNVLGTWLRL